MLKLIPALVAVALAMPAGATPTQREVINPDELMVLVPSLEFLGYSRISTVEHCAALVGVTDWMEMITDNDLEGMEACLIEHT